MTRVPHTGVVTLMILFAVGTSLVGAATASAGCAGWCRGHPQSTCKSFMVFETGIKMALGGSDNLGGEDWLLTADIGYMKNITPSSAIGGTIYVGTDDGGTKAGLRMRYRKWLNRTVSIDLSPGLLLVGSDNRSGMRLPGFIASADLNFGDWVALSTQYQIVRHNRSYQSYNTGSNFYLGARFGSYAALGLPVAALAVLIAVASSGGMDPGAM